MTQENEQVQHYVNLQQLHNQVENLFSVADASDYIEAQNEMLQSFLQRELKLKKKDGFSVKYIEQTIFLNQQLNLLLVKLQELV